MMAGDAVATTTATITIAAGIVAAVDAAAITITIIATVRITAAVATLHSCTGRGRWTLTRNHATTTKSVAGNRTSSDWLARIETASTVRWFAVRWFHISASATNEKQQELGNYSELGRSR